MARRERQVVPIDGSKRERDWFGRVGEKREREREIA